MSKEAMKPYLDKGADYDTGRHGVGEVPGGEKIRQTLEDAKALVVGQPIGQYKREKAKLLKQVKPVSVKSKRKR